MAYNRRSGQQRPHMGKSIIGFPKDYVMIDIETTGLKPSNDEILELSAIRIRDHQIEQPSSTLDKPNQPISGLTTNITGISNHMVVTAPPIEQAMPEFLDFIQEDIILGYIVNFDLSFIYDIAVNL